MSDKKKGSRRDFLRGRIKLDRPTGELDTPQPAPAAEDQKRIQANYLQHFSKRAMACDFELFFNMNQYPQSPDAATVAFSLVDQIESRLSVYQPDSEISQLNLTAATEPFSVGKDIQEVLQLADQIFRDTKGAFDVTSTPLSKVWGFFQRNGQIPADQDLNTAMEKVGQQHVRIADAQVSFNHPATEINFNSIGKGYALDRVASEILTMGISDFILHGGQSSVIARGNETVAGDDEAAGWPVGLSHPFIADDRIAEIFLHNCSLSTSGTARQGFFHEGRRYGHVIDPRTGWPTDHFLSVTVVCESTAMSDALATAFFVMSLEEVQAYCDEHTDVAALAILPKSKTGGTEIETFNVPKDILRIL